MATTVTPKRKARAKVEAGSRVELEMPAALRAELGRLADERGVTLEQLITTELTKAIGRDVVETGMPHAHMQQGVDEEPSTLRPLTGLALGINLAVVSFAGALAIALLLVALGDAL
jgi:hypothetical protein